MSQGTYLLTHFLFILSARIDQKTIQVIRPLTHS